MAVGYPSGKFEERSAKHVAQCTGYVVPRAWLLLGFVLLAPIIVRERLNLIVLAAVVGDVCIPEVHTFWSPYYRVELTRLPSPDAWPRPSAYSLVENHVWYRRRTY